METKQRKARTLSLLNNFGKFCSKLRIDLGYTLGEWAEELGISTQTVNVYEFGRKELDTTHLVKVGRLISNKVPHALVEFNNQFAIPAGVVLLDGLTKEQINLIIAAVNGTVRLEPEELKTPVETE